MTTKNEKKPIRVIRHGFLKASIWLNTGEKGNFYSTRLTRTWKDDQGEYHDSDHYSHSELLSLAHLAKSAYDAILEMRAESRANESS